MPTDTEKTYFLRTERLGFRWWQAGDLPLALDLWSDPEVTRMISNEPWSNEQVVQRLNEEIGNAERHRIQYWPVFRIEDDAHVGCVGLRPHSDGIFEFGFYLKPDHWGRGYAGEAGKGVIEYAFKNDLTRTIFAAHHPSNKASRNALIKLGFIGTTAQFFERTGLMHPSYLLYRGERDYSTRPVVPSDARALALVHCHSIRDTFQMLPDYVAARSLDYCEAKWDERVHKETSKTLALLHGEQLVGFVTACASPDEDVLGKAGQVDRIYIHPCAWNRGFGKTLMEWCEKTLKDQGFNLIKLWVFEVNERARHFYERHGYQSDGSKRSDFGGSILRYSKTLEDNSPEPSS